MRRFTSTVWPILAVTLLCSGLQAQTRTPAGGKARLPLVDELKQTYRLSHFSVRFGGEPNIQYGAPFQVRQSGIMGLPRTNLAVAVATFENGVLKQPGFTDRMMAGENAYWFQPGERVFADKFDVDTKKDRITFTLVNEDYSFKAGLHFKFPKNFLMTANPDQIIQTISQVIAFEEAGNNQPPQQQQQQQYPPQQYPSQSQQLGPPQGAPPPATPPMNVPPAAPPASAPSSGAAVAPLICNGQVVGFGPAGVAMLPANQPPTGPDKNSWIPLIRNGQILAYAPPGSTVWPQASESSDGGQAQAPPPAEPAPADSQPPTIQLGQTADQVRAILGTPEKVANLGAKVIFIYKDMKVTLTDGKVTDVQ